MSKTTKTRQTTKARMTHVKVKREQGAATALSRQGIRDARRLNPRRLPPKHIQTAVGLKLMQTIGEPTVDHIVGRMNKEVLGNSMDKVGRDMLSKLVRAVVGTMKRSQWAGQNIPGYAYHRNLGRHGVLPTVLNIHQPVSRLIIQRMAFEEGFQHDAISRLLHPDRKEEKRYGPRTS